MKKIIVFSFLLSLVFVQAQNVGAYQFKSIKDLDVSAVKNQGNTGTCWSFATESFLESEIYRINGQWIDLSEMYVVRQMYPVKAWNYVYRQGHAQFGEGGLSHDVLYAVKKFGLMPQSAYDGNAKDGQYNHSKLEKESKQFLNNLIQNPKENLTSKWVDEYSKFLDEQLGEVPESFVYDGEKYTPKSFASQWKIEPENYVTLTSFLHAEPGEAFILSIPDNFLNGTYHNIELDLLMETMKSAVVKGYTIALDADVSEPFFMHNQGIAIYPEDENTKKDAYKKEIVKEKMVTPEEREALFMDYTTTDDHLMHIVGVYEDQNGNIFFKVKNSWGTNSELDGYLMMSEAYLRCKTIAITLHKEALDGDLMKKLNL